MKKRLLFIISLGFFISQSSMLSAALNPLEILKRKKAFYTPEKLSNLMNYIENPTNFNRVQAGLRKDHKLDKAIPLDFSNPDTETLIREYLSDKLSMKDKRIVNLLIDASKYIGQQQAAERILTEKEKKGADIDGLATTVRLPIPE